MSYIVENLAGFFRLLRKCGMNISVYDCLTAVEALQHVDITDRFAVKTAFKACLAKSVQERGILSAAFDLYFVPENKKKANINARAELIENKKQEIAEEAARLKFLDTPLELTREHLEIFAGLPEAEKQSLENFLEKTSAGKNVRMEFKQLAETMVKSRLNGLKYKYSRELEKTRGVLSLDTSEAGIMAGQIMEEYNRDNSFLLKNIGDIGEEEVPAAVRLIAAMVERLRRELDRRYKKGGKNNRLDLKRTIRSNLSTGQVLFRLKYRKRSRAKNKLVLLCDVSASMLRFSGFVLNFITGMSRCFLSMDCYIFSEDAEKINIKPYKGLSEFEEQVKARSVWGKGTNIGAVFSNILKDRSSHISSSTVMVIVSDAKTVDAALAEQQLKELSTRVRRVLWLNPVPESQWEKVKGLKELAKHCEMMDCSTLERIEAAFRKL